MKEQLILLFDKNYQVGDNKDTIIKDLLNIGVEEEGSIRFLNAINVVIVETEITDVDLYKGMEFLDYIKVSERVGIFNE